MRRTFVRRCSLVLAALALPILLIGPAASASAPSQTKLASATLNGSGSTFQYGYDQDGKSAQIVLRRVTAQFEDDLNSRKLNAATTVDAFASWPVAPRLQIVARGENLLDKLVMAGVNSDGSVERATPRTLWIGLRVR